MSNDQNNRYDVCVIGAGASGLVSAAEIAKRGRSVLLIEQNKKSGRKLYATGNGKCNLANAVISDSVYYGSAFAKAVVNEASAAELRKYLLELGIPLVEERDGYFYPQSLQASGVVWALTDAARAAGVHFLYDTEVTGIEEEENGYLLQAGGPVHAEKLVLALGSPAAPHLGAAKPGTIGKLLTDLKLPYTPFEAALCPLMVEEDVSPLAGVRVKAELLLEENGDVETGELQMTEYGISGIAVFNLSTYASIGSKLRIDLLPLWKDADTFLAALNDMDPGRRMDGVLNGFLHEKLCRFFLEMCFGQEAAKKPLGDFSREELKKLFQQLKQWRLTVSGKKGEMGQACRGGILTDVVDPKTMQVSRSRENMSDIGRQVNVSEEAEPHGNGRLAVTGEALDVVGRCGGYNLMFALISGIRAGRMI